MQKNPINKKRVIFCGATRRSVRYRRRESKKSVRATVVSEPRGVWASGYV